jgi:hypothetical protein
MSATLSLMTAISSATASTSRPVWKRSRSLEASACRPGSRKRAGCGDPGNCPQRAAGRARHAAGLLQHYRRAARRQRDRIGILSSARRGQVTVRRKRPAQARGRQVLKFGPRGLSATLRVSPAPHRAGQVRRCGPGYDSSSMVGQKLTLEAGKVQGGRGEENRCCVLSNRRRLQGRSGFLR